jgi:hypothetical protein
MSTSVSSTAGQSLDTAAESDTIRVNALHALNYCQRLYYLEEVEQLYPTFRRLTRYFQYVYQEAMAEMYIRQGFQG